MGLKVQGIHDKGQILLSLSAVRAMDQTQQRHQGPQREAQVWQMFSLPDESVLSLPRQMAR
jgi:hypothetical protein